MLIIVTVLAFIFLLAIISTILSYKYINEATFAFKVCVYFFGGIGTLVCICLTINTWIMHATKENSVIELNAKRDSLIYNLEREDIILDRVALLNEVAEFNSKVLTSQNNIDNLWLNWFTDPAYEEIEPIDLESFK